MKIFILGSCVSKDCFNYSQDSLELVAYYPQHSCISALLDSLTYEDINFSHSKYKFKQNIIYDFRNQLLYDLQTVNYDILLIDFVDEFFYTKNNDSNVVINKNLQNKDISLDNNLICTNDDINFSLWYKAWNNFISLCTKIGIKDKIVINRVYFSNFIQNNTQIPNFTEKDIILKNELIDHIYKYIEKYIPKSRYIDYPDNLIIANNKINLPFYYIDSFYYHTIQCLINIASIPASLKDRIYKNFYHYSFRNIFEKNCTYAKNMCEREGGGKRRRMILYI